MLLMNLFYIYIHIIDIYIDTIYNFYILIIVHFIINTDTIYNFYNNR